MFSIPWKHAARHGWEVDKDACIFKQWAIHTGEEMLTGLVLVVDVLSLWKPENDLSSTCRQIQARSDWPWPQNVESQFPLCHELPARHRRSEGQEHQQRLRGCAGLPHAAGGEEQRQAFLKLLRWQEEEKGERTHLHSVARGQRVQQKH